MFYFLFCVFYLIIFDGRSINKDRQAKLSLHSKHSLIDWFGRLKNPILSIAEVPAGHFPKRKEKPSLQDQAWSFGKPAGITNRPWMNDPFNHDKEQTSILLDSSDFGTFMLEVGDWDG